MSKFIPFVMLAISSLAWGQQEQVATPRHLKTQDLPTAVEADALERQYDALAKMQLQTLDYSGHGPIQDIDGATGIVLPGRARALKKGDQGADVLQLLKDVLLATGNEELEVRDNDFVDATTRNLTFTQSIRGIPVLLSVVSIEYNDETREVSGLTANFLPDRGLPVMPKITAQQAEQAVPQALDAAKDTRGRQVEIDQGTYLGYYVNSTEQISPSLVWVVRATLADGTRVDCFVDATNARIVQMGPAESSLSRTVYDVQNKPNIPYPSIPNQYKIATADIPLNDTAWYAYDNVAKVNTSLSNRFPTAVSKLPQTVKIAVNWNWGGGLNAKHGLEGSTDYLRFSGESQLRWSYGTPLNIVAHEFAHGFSTREVGDNSNFTDRQSFALKESFSDIMGTVVDIANGSDASLLSSTWVAGHGIFKSSSQLGFRSFKDPMGDFRAFYAPQSIDWYPSRLRTWEDSYGHGNSTILSHAYYLLVFGGQHVRYGDPGIPNITVPALGEAKARNIFMRAFQDQSMDSEPTFLKMKTAAIAAGASLYPSTNASTATKKAFEAVGVCGVAAAPPPKMSLTSLGDILCAGRFFPTWNVVPGATQYYGEVGSQQLGFALATPVTSVDGGTTHCAFQVSGPAVFHIQACNDCGCGPWSETYVLNYWSPCP